MAAVAGGLGGGGGGDGFGAGGAGGGGNQQGGGGGGDDPYGGLSESDWLKTRQLEEISARIAKLEYVQQMKRKQSRYNQRKN